MSQMYDWITKNGVTWNPLAGSCPHGCSYCYVNDMKAKFPILMDKYSGEPRIVKKELKKKFKPGQTVFVCSMNDLFAKGIPTEYIEVVTDYTLNFPDTTFLFQSKNTERLYEFCWRLPENSIVGTTIETDKVHLSREHSNAPSVEERALWMRKIREEIVHSGSKKKVMVSTEPIMDFSPIHFLQMIRSIRPDFVSIGADSKNHNLPEPSPEKVRPLIKGLEREGIEVRAKDNLKRILGGSE